MVADEVKPRDIAITINGDTQLALKWLTDEPDYRRWARLVALDGSVPEWLKAQQLISLIEDRRPYDAIDYEQVDWAYVLADLKSTPPQT